MKRKPNVLMILTDQFNPNCLGFLGSQVKTPNLDRLAGDGVYFPNAFCNAPICGPSRASYVTGQYPRTHRIHGNHIFEMNDRNEHTLGAVFRRSGYETALVGKAHMIEEWDREGFEHRRYCDLIDCDKSDPLKNDYFRHLNDNGLADEYDLGTLKDDHTGKKSWAFMSDIPDEHSLETWTGNEALNILRNRDETRPFFMLMSFQRPHTPYTAPKDTGLLYDPEQIELPANAADYFENDYASKPAFIRQFFMKEKRNESKADYARRLKETLAYYYTLITHIDTQIGRVIEHLESAGEYGNTVISFSADHGDFAGEHGQMKKNAGIYDSIHRIPFILRYPDGPAGARREGLVESIDLYPTFCGLCGIGAPDAVEGESLLPVAEGRNGGKAQAFAEFNHGWYDNTINAIVTGRHRLVYYNSELGGELYDREKDPGELNNLYDDPACRDIRERLMCRLFDHVNNFSLKASIRETDKLHRFPNSFCSMLQFGKKSWKEIEPLYRETRR